MEKGLCSNTYALCAFVMRAGAAGALFGGGTVLRGSSLAAAEEAEGVALVSAVFCVCAVYAIALCCKYLAASTEEAEGLPW